MSEKLAAIALDTADVKVNGLKPMPPVKPERFVFIDALRGIAACLVLLHHMLNDSPLYVTLCKILPKPLIVVADYGGSGVYIFFVLSGFVITHSLRNVHLIKSNVGNFILRRQIRLDPAFWVILGLTLLKQRAERLVPSLPRGILPGFLDIGANILYLPRILNRILIVPQAWTLCIEVQFYLLFILLLFIGQRGKQTIHLSGISLLSILILSLTGVLSLLNTFLALASVQSPWFVTFWFYFVAGVLCYCAVEKQIDSRILLGYLSLFWFIAIYQQAPGMIVGATTTTVLYGVGASGHLKDWLNQRFLQYLGRISYSVYISHMLIATTVLKIGYKLTGQNTAAALLWFLLAGILSIVGGHMLYILVESPSMRYAASLKKL